MSRFKLPTDDEVEFDYGQRVALVDIPVKAVSTAATAAAATAATTATASSSSTNQTVVVETTATTSSTTGTVVPSSIPASSKAQTQTAASSSRPPRAQTTSKAAQSSWTDRYERAVKVNRNQTGNPVCCRLSNTRRVFSTSLNIDSQTYQARTVAI